MGAILKKMAIFSKGNALCPVENPFIKVFLIINSFIKGFPFINPLIKRISVYKRVGAILKKIAIFNKENALCTLENLIEGVFFLVNALNIDRSFFLNSK